MTSSLLLCDLAARDLAATNTSIFRTGSSSTAKRIGKEATPQPDSSQRTEPNRTTHRLTHTQLTAGGAPPPPTTTTECVFLLGFFAITTKQTILLLLHPRTSHALLA